MVDKKKSKTQVTEKFFSRKKQSYKRVAKRPNPKIFKNKEVLRQYVDKLIKRDAVLSGLLVESIEGIRPAIPEEYSGKHGEQLDIFSWGRTEMAKKFNSLYKERAEVLKEILSENKDELSRILGNNF